MNKILTKVATLALGAAMAVGVGVAVGSKKVSEAKAATVGTDLVQVTALTSGNQYVIVGNDNGYALPTNPTVSSGKVAGVAIASVPSSGSGYLWTITASGDYWLIGDGSKYIYHTNGGSSGTNLTYGTSTTIKWKLTYSTDTQNHWTFTAVNNTTESSRGMLVNGTNFGGYALTNETSYKFMNIYELSGSACEHNWVAGESHAATCTENGYTEYECSKCHETKQDDVVQALGHDFGDVIVDTAATCTEAGAGHKVCSRDSSHVENVVIPALGHNFVNGVCTVCGAEQPNEETAACTFSDLYSANTMLDDVTIALDSNISIVFATGGTATQYYTNGTAVRWYSSATLTITSTAGNILSISITYLGKHDNAVSANVGSYTDITEASGTATWIGSSEEVVFTESGTTGHDRISAIEVTYDAGGTPPTPVETHDVIFNANGTNVTGMPSNLTDQSGTVQLSGVSSPSREGYTFKGWSLTEDGSVVTSVTVSNADVNVYAIWDENTPTPEGAIIDTWEVSTFEGAPSSYTTDGTEYDKVGPLTGVSYHATGINSSGNIRGNKTASAGNFNLRNSTTKSGYYISKLEVTQSGGKIDTLSDNRSVLIVGNSVFAKLTDDEVPTGTQIKAKENSSEATSLTFENSDTSVSYFQLYSLKTSGTCASATITVTWTQSSDPSAPNLELSLDQSGDVPTELNYKNGNYLIYANSGDDKQLDVEWSSSNTEVFTVSENANHVCVLTPVKPGTSTLKAEKEGYNSASVSITIVAGSVSSIAVTGSMSKTSYFVGDEWSHSGLVASATYSTGYVCDVSEDADWSYNPTEPALNVSSVVATAAFGGKSGTSSAQTVSVERANPIQALYSKSKGASTGEFYGYYVGFATGSGPIVMDGEYGIMLFNSSQDVSGWEKGKTILHISSGKIDVYNGLYEVKSYAVEVVESADIEKPIVHTTTGSESATDANRSTTATGVVAAAPTKGSFTGDPGASDIQFTYTVGSNTFTVYYKKAAQTSEVMALLKDSLDNGTELTLDGFTSWYNNFQLTMIGLVEEAQGYTAIDFAQDLLDQTDEVCEGFKDGDNNHDALVAIWSDLASADKYPSLPSDQKEILAEADRDEEGSVVEQAMARYDFLTGKYNLSNFINGRTPIVPAGSYIASYQSSIDSSSSITIIVVVAVASMTLLGVTLVLRKRKHQ